MANKSLPNDPRAAKNPIAHTIQYFNPNSPDATDASIIQDYAAPTDWVAQCTAKADASESYIAALASWKSESHVEVPSKKKAPPTP